MFPFLTRKMNVAPELCCLLLNICFCVTAWPRAPTGDTCPSAEWSIMCRPCCEYHLIQCQCPSKGSRVGYTVPCCRNALDQCDPCIIHPGCSLFENCKTCHNGTWRANDDFFVNGKFCTECRQGWSGGDCKTCGGVIQRAQGLVVLESYPTNARCEWRVRVQRGRSIELRFSLLSLESDHTCRYDYVEVRNGDDLSSPVIGRFCGDQLPPPIKSSGNRLHILFTSDGYNNFDGFALTFQESSGSLWGSRLCTSRGTSEWILAASVRPPAEACACELPVSSTFHSHWLPAEELSAWWPVEWHRSHVCERYFLPPGFLWASFLILKATRCICWKILRLSFIAHTGQTSRVQCAPPPKLLNGYYRPAQDTAGGAEAETMEFFCKNSFVLSGNHQSTCLSNGSWSSRPPKCVRACREPKVSELVRQSRHDVSLDELPRGFHSVHTSIKYKCASPLYRHTGSPRRTCLKSGRWSGRHVSCSPVCGKFDTFSPQNLSETQWPWHAAVYVRSPPDRTARGHRSQGVSGGREASEESTFWLLACSGALLAQRSVLVAARCVVDKDEQRPLHPAHVKVVIGVQQQHQASRAQSKSLHHLRVSDILVHPNFDFTPDASVAVLKLKDKARISERVLPVCLPRMHGGDVTERQAYTSRWIPPDNHRHLSRYAAPSQTELVELSDVAHCEEARGGTRTAASTLCVVERPSSPESPCAVPGLTTLPAVFPPTGRVLSGQEETRGASSSSGWQLLALEGFSYEENNCHRQTHSAQTRVGSFQDWIEDNMN
ncbi:inactive serine protease PAMR1 isoform X1 [Hippoglossus stenolepis]|uniref:inactive serine protease PAMR1 isoform X1 n=1 Tax=Hippoglossus stenolepis TaxID=195615 RepID=UPI00159CAE5F|nr:inactive serine protease PAMR1 isoform X1 [Hippoglossus stenolepis]